MSKVTLVTNRTFGRVFILVLVGSVWVCPLKLHGQSQVFQEPAPKRTHILNHFRKELGKGLKVYFSATTRFGIKDEQDYVVAVTKDNNDERPKLRVFEDTVKGFMERFVDHPGDVFNKLYFDDLTNDGTLEIVTMWQSGQQKNISIIAYTKNRTLSKIFTNGGREIDIRAASDGTKEIVIKRRTYAENKDQPWAMASDIYHWNGREFTQVMDNEKR